MTERAPVLDADGIGKAFGFNVVLKSAGFAVRPGRITALMGRNGAGKTTLLRIASGTIRSDHGRLRFKEQYVARPTAAALARSGLMFISQDSALTASFSVAVHLEAVSRTFGKEDNLDTVLSLLALSTLVERMPRDLSGGERQRVSLGLAMLREPDCLLMDEPFAGVAPVDVPAIGGALLALRNSGVGIAISGHDVRQIFDVSDEVIWMVAGTTHWLGAPAQARAHDQFRREYLGPRAMVD